jgi:NADH-quinone oxidoreductase subunit J
MLASLLFAELPPLSRFLAESWPVLVPVTLGLAAVYLLLPRARRYPPLWGGLLGGLAIVVAGWWLVHFRAVSPEAILFYAFAGIAILSAGLMITHSNPVYAALSFAMVVLATCGLFLLLGAPFLTAATVIIYAGAIVVIFLFVIMLAQQLGYSSADQRSREPFLASLAGFVLLAAVLCVLQRTYSEAQGWAKAYQDKLQPLLKKTEKAKDAHNEVELQVALGANRELITDFRKFLDELEALKGRELGKRLKRLSDELDEADAAWAGRKSPNPEFGDPVENSRNHLQKLYQEGELLLAQLQMPGTVVPFPDPDVKPSPFALPPQQETAEPGKLPAENVAGLGRLLFTDYLLAVELAGFLLLVATIGAIAIAARRTEELR